MAGIVPGSATLAATASAVLVREVAVYTGSRFDGFYFELVENGAATGRSPDLPAHWAQYPVQRMTDDEKRAVRVAYWGYDSTDWNPAEWEGEQWRDGRTVPLTDGEIATYFERVDKAGNVGPRMDAPAGLSIRRKSAGIAYNAEENRYETSLAADFGQRNANLLSQLTADEQQAIRWASVVGDDASSQSLVAWLLSPAGRSALASAQAKASQLGGYRNDAGEDVTYRLAPILVRGGIVVTPATAAAVIPTPTGSVPQFPSPTVKPVTVPQPLGPANAPATVSTLPATATRPVMIDDAPAVTPVATSQDGGSTFSGSRVLLLCALVAAVYLFLSRGE